MDSARKYVIGVTVCAMLADLPLPLSAGSKSDVPSAKWTPGKSWKLSVKTYPKEQPDKNTAGKSAQAAKEFLLYAHISGYRQVKSTKCWSLVFLHPDNGPNRFADRYYIYVDPQGWTRKMLHIKYSKTPAPNSKTRKRTLVPLLPKKFGPGTLAAIAPPAFPLEIFPLTDFAQIDREGGKEAFAIRRKIDGKNILLEAVYKIGTAEKLVIRQKWLQGESWWREYERFVNGRKDLSARLVIRKPAPAAANGSSPLRRDPRLRVKMRVFANNLQLPELFDRVEKATGLKLTIDPKLKDHDPVLGSIQFKSAPACVVMEVMARRQLQEGRWLKTKDGYQLTAKASLSAQYRAKHERARAAAAKRRELAARFPLRLDSRLRKKLTLIDTDPPLSMVLHDLNDATGLTFTLAENLADHDPKFGSVKFSNAYAWSIMEMIAYHQLQNGRWQKTATGYRLVGISTVPVAATPPAPSFWGHTLTLIMLAIAAVVFAALCGFAIYRKSSRPAPPASRT